MVEARRRLLLCEIELQCGFVLHAYRAAAAALQRKDRDGFWYSAQALLGAAAHLHDFLSRDADLRQTLNIRDHSPLLRPELAPAGSPAAAWSDWLSAHAREPLRLTNFGPHGVSGAGPDLFARFIDVDRSLCMVFGKAYDIAELMATVAEVQHAVKEELRRIREVV